MARGATRPLREKHYFVGMLDGESLLLMLMLMPREEREEAPKQRVSRPMRCLPPLGRKAVHGLPVFPNAS